MTDTVIVTISRQMGSGGSEIGFRLAKSLGLRYIDREILTRTAVMLDEKEQVIADRLERVSGFWEEALHSLCMGSAETGYTAPPVSFIPDNRLFEVRNLIMKDIAAQCSAVIVGHAGFHILRDHPRLVNIFVGADPDFRARRVMEQYSVASFEEALSMIRHSDRERRKLIGKITGKEWTDALNFHLCLDSRIGLDTAVGTAARCIEGVTVASGKPFPENGNE